MEQTKEQEKMVETFRLEQENVAAFRIIGSTIWFEHKKKKLTINS